MNFRNQLLNISLVAIFGLLFTFNACTDDSCDNIDCGPNAIDCVDGVCNCATGYYGTNCETFCGEHSLGYDLTTGTCICENGYTGADCSQLIDPCANVSCGDHGTCVVDTDGTASCACNTGWTGTDCNTFALSNYVGIYSQVDECNSGTYEVNGDVIVTNNVVDATKINFSNWGGFGITIYANVNGNTFSIPSQTVTDVDNNQYTVVGNTTGSWNYFPTTNTTVLSINYTVTSGTSDTCTAVLTKK
ncbi:MAG: hypothetical protein R2798_04670 [Chitinophagales bacterium]|nr:hypothetical protein [Bacteroidota bacterium]